MTAEEFLVRDELFKTPLTEEEKHYYIDRIITHDDYIKGMIEFAKYHVEQTLDLASKKSKVDLHVRKDKKGAKYKLAQNGEEYDLFRTVQMYKVNKESILKSYSLENIK